MAFYVSREHRFTNERYVTVLTKFVTTPTSYISKKWIFANVNGRYELTTAFHTEYLRTNIYFQCGL